MKMKRLEIKTAHLIMALVCCWIVLTGNLVLAETGGVLFYAGFNGTRDAQAVGIGKATLVAGGGAITADGFDSIRGGALQTGDGIGYLEFSATGNVLPDEGTIEMWIRPDNWSGDDNQQHIYLNISGDGGGIIRFYKRADTVNSFWVRAPDVPDPKHFDDKYDGMVGTGYVCQQMKGKWCQYFFIWKKGEYIAKYRGNLPPGPTSLHRTVVQPCSVPSPGKLTTINIGDFGGGEDRNAITLIDEVYIYNRALTWEECQWANANATSRVSGTDIPTNFAQPTANVVPDQKNNTLVVEVDSGDRSGNFGGTVRLEPAAGTSPAPIVQTEGRFGQAVIPYTDLPQGEYKAICDIITKDGKPITTLQAPLVVPGPPVWLTEKVGVSDTPPPPWGPIQVEEGNKLRVWGREYLLGEFGLPAEVKTQGASILAGPVSFQAVSRGAKVNWTQEERQISSQTDAMVVWEGTSRSTLGELNWRTQAEFDGFLLYDFTLTPAADAGAELIELRVPIRKEYAYLWYKGSSERGFLPKGTGAIYKADFGRYWWLGTDDFGLCGATEHAGANFDDAQDVFSIVREDNGDITVVYRFLGKPQKLTQPWRLRWILQATPTKPLPKDWRTWRDVSRGFPSSPHPVKLAVIFPNAWEQTHLYFPIPVVRDPQWYREYVNDLHNGTTNSALTEPMALMQFFQHDKGVKVLPYSLFVCIPPEMPECVFYWREWFNPVGGLNVTEGWVKYASARLVPSYIDFLVWKHRELAKDYGHDGLYVDFAGAWGGPVTAPEHGLGYIRNGKEYPATFPVVAAREMWKRVYTMFKELKPDSVIIGHVSAAVHAPVLSFCDIWLNGEGNWRGPLRDNYLDVLPLDQLRAAFRTQHFGGIPWWLDQWYGATLEDKDILIKQANGKPSQVSDEKSHHILGLGLLHDIGFWAICGTNGKAQKQFFDLQDKFGIADANFSGYWNNADLIGGQSEAIKASAYKKPKGGALVVVYNVTRQPKTVNLTIAWERLKSEEPLSVTDAYTEAQVEVKGKLLAIAVPPLNYRLLWVK